MGEEQTAPQLSKKERRLRKFARLAVKALYRDVEVYRAADAPVAGPQVSVSNHFGGFADPLLLTAAMQRPPRIVARDKIWSIPVAGRIMDWLGAIAVHKPEEHAGLTSNQQMFATAYEALADDANLLIFPEGITVDDPSIAKIKTGAARIALGARQEGTNGVKIVPAGIHYENKAALRSRVSINIGSPIDLDTGLDAFVPEGEDTSPENRPLVRAVTEAIETRLRRAAPDFEDWPEAKALTDAAEVTLRAEQDDHMQPVSISMRDRLAGQLGRSEAPAKSDVRTEIDTYDTELDAFGLSDTETYDRTSFFGFLWYAIWNVALGIVLLPFALVGIAINFIPLLIVWGLGLLPVSPAVKATLKPMAALLLFPITWALVAWQVVWDSTGPIITLIAVLLIPLYLAAAIILSERLVLLWRAWRSLWKGRNIARIGPELAESRARVVDAVRTAVPRTPDTHVEHDAI